MLALEKIDAAFGRRELPPLSPEPTRHLRLHREPIIEPRSASPRRAHAAMSAMPDRRSFEPDAHHRQRKPVAELTHDDPRWVLAVRTSLQMEGPILRPDRRERLIAAGRAMGLSPFESNLVIALVQDQARRGGDLEDAAGALALMARPTRPLKRRSSLPRLAVIAAAALFAEALILWLSF